MDRSETNNDLETSIVCLLDSMKLLLSTTELTCFMGAKRHNIAALLFHWWNEPRLQLNEF